MKETVRKNIFTGYWTRFLVYYIYYRRTGLYRFLIINFIKLIIVFAAIFVGFYMLEKYIIDIKDILPAVFEKMPQLWVYLSFYVSESIIGLIPPDFLILWAEGFNNSFLVLLILALISYLGGITAYFLGILLLKVDFLKEYIEKRYKKQGILIKKWGGALIIIAALFPLPWGVICTLSGLVKFPVRTFLIFALVRLFRFHLYSLVLYSIL